jgi:hypothetical protein
MSAYTVSSHQNKIDAAFERVRGIEEVQLQADFARYLCVVVSGFLEQAVRHVLGHYAVERGHPRVARYAERQLSGFTNANAQKLIDLVGGFDARWREELAAYLVGERKDAIDSVVANRHNIVHGRDVGITYRRIADYYGHVKDTVHFLEIQIA